MRDRSGTVFYTLNDAKRWAEERSSTPEEDFIITKQTMTIRGITEEVYILTKNYNGPTYGNPFK